MEAYAGQQFVGIDLHRRRSVIVRTTDRGDPLETVRISNDVDSLTKVMARAGVSPEVVLEATYGWYWAADVLADLGAVVHLAHPLGVKGFAYRQVKNDVRDATDLADLLRMGRLPEAWIAPPATRELRELVRHRAKLVAIRSGCKCEIHAVLAKCGIQVLMSDLFADAGIGLLERLEAPVPTGNAANPAGHRRPWMPAGSVVLVGMGGDTVQLPLSSVQDRELTITGAFRYANTWPTAIRLAAFGRVDLDAVVSGHYGLRDVEAALTASRDDPTSMKAIVRPGE
jgi:hypothetical protein